MQKLAIEGRRVGNVIGSGGEGLRKLEDKHKIILSSTRDDIFGFGAQEKVQKAMKEIDTMLATASVDQKENIPTDIAKLLVSESGKAVRGFESETGASIKVNVPQSGDVASVNLKGTKDAVEKALKKIKTFQQTTATEFVKADGEAIQRLFGQRSGKGGDIASKFQEIRDRFQIAVLRNPEGVSLAGDKKKVADAKKEVEAIVVRAKWTQDTFSLEHRDQARALEGTAMSEVSGKSGADVTIRRAGKGGDVWLEIYGDDAAKQSATKLLNDKLDREARVRSSQVPVNAVSLFLQKGAQAIRDLEKSTGCSISLNRSDGSVTLMGPKSNLDTAEDAVKKTADKFDKQQANMTTDEMEIDADDVGLVVGKQGSTVKYITRTSGAEIAIAKDSTKITISGSAEQVQAAKKLITDTIERKAAPEEETWTETPVTVTPKPKKVEKKENAPDLEAKELFPSLGAALGGAGSKRAMRSAKMQLKQKAETMVNGNGKEDFEPPARNGHVSAPPTRPAVLFETKRSSIGSITGSHKDFWKDFRAESAKALDELAA